MSPAAAKDRTVARMWFRYPVAGMEFFVADALEVEGPCRSFVQRKRSATRGPGTEKQKRGTEGEDEEEA